MKELISQLRKEHGIDIRDFRNHGKGFDVVQQPKDFTMIKIGYSIQDNFMVNLNISKPQEARLTAQAAIKLKLELNKAVDIVIELNAKITGR